MGTKSTKAGIILVGLLLFAGLSACSSSAPQGVDEAQVSPVVIEPTQMPPSDIPFETPPAATQVEAAEATEVIFQPPPPGFELGDPNLRATSPDGVKIASGEIQLIEFFAFW